MKSYPQELKDRLTARMLAPHNESITALAWETQIPKDTLYGWRVAALGRVSPTPPTESLTGAVPSSDVKFAIVVETARPERVQAGRVLPHQGPLCPAGAGLAGAL
jgi:transposase-like protein